MNNAARLTATLIGTRVVVGGWKSVSCYRSKHGYRDNDYYTENSKLISWLDHIKEKVFHFPV